MKTGTPLNFSYLQHRRAVLLMCYRPKRLFLAACSMGCLLYVCAFIHAFATQGSSANNKWEAAAASSALPQHPIPASKPPVRIMCMVTTTVQQWNTKAQAVSITWGRRCDIIHFYYSLQNVSINHKDAVGLQVPEGRDYLTNKTFTMLDHAYSRYKDNADWFLKADDDTYIIMENLRHLVADLDTNKGHYLGGQLYGYNSGGAGYVLSRRSLHVLVEDSRKTRYQRCRFKSRYEDMAVGFCLQKYGITPRRTMDNKRRLKFHPINPLTVLRGRVSEEEKSKMSKGSKKVGETEEDGQSFRMQSVSILKDTWILSPVLISMHYVPPEEMLLYDFLLYDIERPLYEAYN